MLSHKSLMGLVEDGVLQNLEDLSQVQGSSIDVRLGHIVLKEKKPPNVARPWIITLNKREAMYMEEVNIRDTYYDLQPGEFILSHTMEKFFMPDYLSATFHLKSTSARSALGHLLAVHIDPGFNDSTLTLEIHNVSKFHTVRLHEGDHIGQIIFWEHEEVPPDTSYRKRGHYNGDDVVSGVKP